MESKLVCCKLKEFSKYDEWYDGRFGSELLFKAKAKCMKLNERTYRWSESGSKASMMCDGGGDEYVEHVVLECERYERRRGSMMEVVRLEVGAWMSDVD